MAKAPAQAEETKNVPATTGNSSAQVPAFMQADRKSKAKIGNMDSTDLIIPRVKLLQGISPEVKDEKPGAKDGVYWHTIAEQPLGVEIRFVPILVKKTTVLWAPRGDDRGILARSSDNIHWDEGYANQEFEVQFKGQAKRKIFTRGNVAESGLADFGSSVPGDKRSAPVASLTYTWLFALLDYPDLSPVAVINTRTAIRAGKQLYNKIELRPAQPYGQIYKMFVTEETGDEGPYNGFGYIGDGYVENEELYNELKALHDRFSSEDTQWRVNEEEDDTGGGSGGPTGERPTGDDNKGKY